MPQITPEYASGIYLVDQGKDKELNEEETVQLLQYLRIKNIPYAFNGNKEK